MGPIALFDKSLLQALSVDEAVLFDYFFYPVVVPIFFVETLADLSKDFEGKRDPEKVVGAIAYKVPEMHGGPCAFHGSLGLASLMGQDPPANGQIPVAGGRPVLVNGKHSVVYDQSPEAQAFSRWQNGAFEEVERSYAVKWRKIVASINLGHLAEATSRYGIDPKSAKNLSQVRELAADVLREISRAEQIQLAFDALKIPENLQQRVIARWHEEENPPLEYFAPYAYHVTLVETLFSLALASGKISSDRPSNRCDISYLHYLPFCNLFTSSDKLHRDCAPLFLRKNQEFVWGQDLKADLSSQNLFLQKLSEEQRNQGLIRLAPTPSEGLIRDLWQRYLPASLAPEREAMLSKAGESALVDKLNKLVESPRVPRPPNGLFEADVESVSIQRMMYKKRGSWFQLPKDLPGPP